MPIARRIIAAMLPTRLLAAALLIVPLPAAARTVVVEEQSIDQLQAAMTARRATSVDLTRAYLARIAAMDRRDRKSVV